MTLRRIAPAFMAALLGGCAAVGPNYHLPETALVNAPSAQGGFVAPQPSSVAAEPPADWWRLYDDPRLDALIGQAFAANTNLRIADANLERSHALLAEAHSRRDVAVAADATVNYVQQSAEAALQHVQPPERYTYNAGVTVGYDLDLFGGIRRGIEAASADDEAMVAARDLVRVNVAAETARAYADICNAGNEIKAARRSVVLQQQSLALTRKLAANGRAASFDVARQSGLVEEVQARIPALAARQLNAAYRLATLTGRPPEEYDRNLLACDTPLTLRSPIPTGDGRSLLARRPDVRAAERRLAAATARIGVATAQLYPDIRLGGSVGSTGAAVDFLSPLTNRFGIGPAITWDLHRNAVRDRIEAAQASTRASLAAFDGTVLSALRETESALTNYAFGLDRLASLRAARDHDGAVASTAEELRHGGRISALALLDAERTSANAEQALAAAQSEVSQDQIAIFLALGGGWQKATTPPVSPDARN